MDYTQILHTLQNAIPTAIWYLIPFFLVAAVIKSPWFKGKAGEALVNLSARLFFDKTRYLLIKNVTLPTGDGAPLIEQIIVPPYGVFMVEMNKRKCRIPGNAIQRHWNQKFQNPLLRNYKNIRTLRILRGMRNGEAHSMALAKSELQLNSTDSLSKLSGRQWKGFLDEKNTVGVKGFFDGD